MNWIKILAWFLFFAPMFFLFGFSLWMIKEITKDDENVKAFVAIMIAAWLIGLVLLILTYFTDLTTVIG